MSRDTIRLQLSHGSLQPALYRAQADSKKEIRPARHTGPPGPSPRRAFPALGHGDPPSARLTASAASEPQREADRILLGRYAPAGVLVNSDLEVLQFRGDTGPYLTPAPGKASLNLLKLVREGLMVGVRAAIERCRKEGGPVRQGE